MNLAWKFKGSASESKSLLSRHLSKTAKLYQLEMFIVKLRKPWTLWFGSDIKNDPSWQRVFLKKTPSEPQHYKLIAVAVYDLGWRQIEKKKKIDKQ